jgi:bifunctional DNA-binding transcriptional regulator/antitoxin component of YhaV-PrlF toxin-antitoxin module
VYPVRVSSRGRIVISKVLMDQHGIEEGTLLHVAECGRALVLVPVPADPVEALRGMFARGPSLTEGLLAERRCERQH